MDLYLKEWRHIQPHHHHHSDSDSDSDHHLPLPLFSSEPTTTTPSSTTCHVSPFSSTTTTSTLPRMVSGLSNGQREELEVQALIYKHVICGASIPPQLLLLFNKTLNNNYNNNNNYSSSSSTSPYNNYLQHYYYQYPSLMQSGGGYWGRGGMDPEPGRCRRTDGKKWRCSKDVVSGHKYCERHVHRGRNRSRKPVEIPTATTVAATLPPLRGGGAGVGLKTGASNAAIAAQSFEIAGGGGSSNFLQNNHRSSDLTSYENKYPFRTTQNESSNNSTKSGDRILRHFFDDWPKSEQDDNNASSSMTDSATGLSISIPENSPSDFSLKLSTGGNNIREEVNVERERAHLNWGSYNVGSMGGGPLAEALRSRNTTNSSPTSVLHQLQRGSVSETSFITT